MYLIKIKLKTKIRISNETDKEADQNIKQVTIARES